MADLCDQAAALELSLREKSIAAIRFANMPDQMAVLECDDCSDPIPEARRRANPAATRCVDCQEFSERGQHAR
jgi:phage/conjugal plasmid C-4 type zinc finger TraR family protein